MDNLIIFDGDDTLWSTMPLYDMAKARFADCVRDLTPSAYEAIRRLDEIDHANVARFGFTRERFPGSMVETYHVLCHERGGVPNPEVESQLLEAGRSVFESAIVPYPDAAECLTRLTSRFHLVLATKGDALVQGQRVAQSGFGHYFSEIRILSEKNDQQFRDIIDDHHCVAELAWSVGNSARSDINPALQCGMNAVLIPRSTWSFEEGDLIDSPRLFVCSSLSEAADLIIERGA